MVVCDNHRKAKKGCCNSCKQCRMCPIPSYCLLPHEHICPNAKGCRRNNNLTSLQTPLQTPPNVTLQSRSSSDIRTPVNNPQHIDFIMNTELENFVPEELFPTSSKNDP